MGVFDYLSLPKQQSDQTYRSLASVPPPRTGNYFATAGTNSVATSASLVNGNLRVAPWLLRRPVTLTRLAAEVTAAGDAGGKFRIVVYADSGDSTPGALVLDAGQIAVDAVATAEVTVSLSLTPGVYWLGGAVQAVTTTQPTMRTVGNGWNPPIDIRFGSSLPGAGFIGIGTQTDTTVTGAAPGTYPYLSTTSNVPRILARAA